MAYTKYSLTPADNNAAPPNGAPEGMLPSAVNDTMRDMMAQIRDVGDGIRGGTYTMTAPVITGGSITGVALSGNTLTNPVITGGAISTSTLTGNTFTNPVISGGSINNTPIGATTANTGAFTTLGATGNTNLDGGTFVFNDSGADKDFRIEGDTDPNLFFTDASTDRIGIGTNSPAEKFHISGTGDLKAEISTNSTNRAAFRWKNGSSSFIWQLDGGGIRLLDETPSAERMRIDSSGSLLIGTTATPSASVYGSVFLAASESRRVLLMSGSSTATSARIEFFNPNGQVGKIETSGSNTTYGTSSDYRLKENIAPMTGALAKVSQLKPCTYTWKADGVAGQGFIAHELQSVVPDAVSGEKDAVNEDGTIKAQGIDTSFLVATLTAAIQELKATVDAQAARIAALENK
jgi:hypothetical protein